jgi:pyrroline-5-carboxylate reductase
VALEENGMRYTTRNKFIGWLREKEPTADVGLACSRSSCPLANHLEDTWGGVADVDDEEMAVWGQPYAKTPRWAAAFIEQVDNYGVREPITARAALEMLGEK